ncbi:unnamed protein product [Caenorhabditis nigoni]
MKNNLSVDDFIISLTGQEVVKEMEKLKVLLPQWTKNLHNYFTSVYPVKRSICRLCNFTPFSPKLFYDHLFHDTHIAKLAKCQISKKLFKFWELNFSDMKELEDEGTEKKKKKKETRNLDIRQESAKFGNFSEGLNMVDRKWDNPGIPLSDPSIKPFAKLQRFFFGKPLTACQISIFGSVNAAKKASKNPQCSSTIFQFIT